MSKNTAHICIQQTLVSLMVIGCSEDLENLYIQCFKVNYAFMCSEHAVYLVLAHEWAYSSSAVSMVVSADQIENINVSVCCIILIVSILFDQDETGLL
jgi:hypothetical protein